MQASLTPRLSFCAIVKNECHNLPRCLASVQPYVDEIVIVDTGSKDGTPEVAMQYGAKVSHFTWCNDFAAARNYAVAQASGDWILTLDADEELVVESQDFRDQLTLQPDVLIYLLPLTEADNQANLTPLQAARVFRNMPTQLMYEGYFHEQLMYQQRFPQRNQVSSLKSLKVLHYGYAEDLRLQKHRNRNLPLLEHIRQEQGLSLRLLHNLATMYEDTGQADKAQQCYSEAFERLMPLVSQGRLPNDCRGIPELLYMLGVQAFNQEDYDTTILLCKRGLEWWPSSVPLVHLTGLLLRELGFLLGAVAYFEHSIQLYREHNFYKEGLPFEQSFMTTYPAYEMGCVYAELEQWQEAVAAFELALSFDPSFGPAKEQLEGIK